MTRSESYGFTPKAGAVYNLQVWSDNYARQLARQNDGEVCEYCLSLSGHYNSCALVNGEGSFVVAEEPIPYTEAERIEAHSLGVKL